MPVYPGAQRTQLPLFDIFRHNPTSLAVFAAHPEALAWKKYAKRTQEVYENNQPAKK